MNLQSAIQFLYPPQCVSCGGETSSDFALCGDCWADTPFISGLVCDACGTPLPGEHTNSAAYCDSCINSPPPWNKGRAALLYSGVGRRLILGLKHGDRSELVLPLAQWLVAAVGELASNRTLIAPVPLHSRRLFTRRFNQSALLAARIAKICGNELCPDLLIRNRQTKSQDGLTREERFENQKGAFSVHRRNSALIKDRHILLIDDVLTTGATLSACSRACLNAGASSVNIAVLARVARDT